jgi:hypothetical protein
MFASFGLLSSAGDSRDALRRSIWVKIPTAQPQSPVAVAIPIHHKKA